MFDFLHDVLFDRIALTCRAWAEGDDVVLVGRSLERLKAAIPSDFKCKGRALYIAKDVSTVKDSDQSSVALSLQSCVHSFESVHLANEADEHLVLLWLQVEGCKEIIDEAVTLLGGRLDILVNNAGINLKLQVRS